MDDFIKNNSIAIIYFTNSQFATLNTKIHGLNSNKIMFIDTDNELDIIEKLNIKSVPLFYIYKNETLIEEIFGTYTNICDIIRLHL